MFTTLFHWLFLHKLIEFYWSKLSKLFGTIYWCPLNVSILFPINGIVAVLQQGWTDKTAPPTETHCSSAVQKTPILKMWQTMNMLLVHTNTLYLIVKEKKKSTVHWGSIETCSGPDMEPNPTSAPTAAAAEDYRGNIESLSCVPVFFSLWVRRTQHSIIAGYK